MQGGRRKNRIGIENKSILNPLSFEEDGLFFTEVIRQQYKGNNCVVSAGFVEGDNKPPVDTIYLRLTKDSVEPTTLLLRPDEACAINWVMAGAVWSFFMNEKHEKET
jgi:hypothetical protein